MPTSSRFFDGFQGSPSERSFRVNPRNYADSAPNPTSRVTGSSPVTHPKKTPEIPRISGGFPFHAYICAYIPVNLAVGTSHKGAPHLLSQAGAMAELTEEFDMTEPTEAQVDEAALAIRDLVPWGSAWEVARIALHAALCEAADRSE